MDRNVLVAREYDRRVVCPKPRRGCRHFRPPLGWYSYYNDAMELKAEAELLGTFAEKGCCTYTRFDTLASPSPFFDGSPPIRVSNPMVEDEHFMIRSFNQVPPTPTSSGCSPVKFSHKPALVRIEGFNLTTQDTQTSSIFAVA